MRDLPDDQQDTDVHAFISEYWRDEDEGGVRPLGHYLSRYPESQVAVARAYLSLLSPGSGAAVSRPQARETGGEATSAAGGVGRSAEGIGQVGPYLLIELLGRGGQGEVFLAEDTRLGRKVAVKTLNGFGVSSAEQLDRFRREAEAASRLDHPNICTVYDTGESAGTPYIAMRYVEGQPLSTLIKNARNEGANLNRFAGETATRSDQSDQSDQSDSERRGSPANASTSGTGSASSGVSGSESSNAPNSAQSSAQSGASSRSAVSARHGSPKGLWAVWMVECAARALHEAHEAGIVHRDVKPGNILITLAGEPVLLDFGLARDLESGDISITQPGELFGTPAYMSPEQLLGSRVRIDERTDVYSLGLVLYECLTLENPFSAPTRGEIYQAIQSKDPPDPRRKNAAVSRALRVVLDTALEKDRDRRYQTALDFAEDLRRVRAYEPIAAQPAGISTRVGRWFQRNPGLAAFGLTVITLLSIGLIVAIMLLDRVQEEKEQKDRALSDVESALDDVLRLSDVKRLRDLAPWSKRLWPARAERVPGPQGMDEWIAEAEGLLERAPQHENARESLEAATTVEGAEGLSPEQGWQLDSLVELTHGVRNLKPRLDEMCARRRFALDVAGKTIDAHREAWREASAEVRVDPRFSGFQLAPQVGLIPLGRDPSTKLHEFAMHGTGKGEAAVPSRGADDRLVIAPGSAVVFVLLPGGSFAMGARSKPLPAGTVDPIPGGAAVDRYAGGDEGPPHVVTLAPFFIAKHEMTQAQWRRVTGSNPSVIKPGRERRGKVTTWLHPVEHVSWADATAALERIGAVLPTEAQWEYACRAATKSVWHTGDGPGSLRGFANVADAGSHGEAPQDWPEEPDFDDGYVFHAPIGTFQPNAFGLHDMHGNVWEWCRDLFGSYSVPVGPGDGMRQIPAESEHKRIFRGGCYFNLADKGRAANRSYADLHFRNHALGVRPVRAVE